MRLWHFIQYHNAVPIAVSIMLLGAGATFAATNPEVVYSTTQEVLSIDNTYLVNKDLASYSPRTQISTVTEDAEYYYIEYVLYTIDLENAVWRDVEKQRTMKVSKAALGQYRDLGVYVTEQLKENIEQESRRLADTQAIERENVSQKVVATVYGGLIGKMLDTNTETLPGYTPVVTPPPPPDPQVAAASTANGSSNASTATSGGASVPQPRSDAGAPIIQVLGNNPARIPLDSAYADLGAAITGPSPADQALGIHIFVNGTEMQTPTIDTSIVGEWTIRYEARNDAGLGAAERVVSVFDPYADERAPMQEAAAAEEAVSLDETASSTTPIETEIEIAPPEGTADETATAEEPPSTDSTDGASAQSEDIRGDVATTTTE